VHALRERPESAKIVEAIIGLSRSLGVSNVAEGIETEADARRLLGMGCLYGQGYLYGRPMPLEALSVSRDSALLLHA
jgi:EAL domain-containing protein (putative c-di-GMP-specific phosphodiesterase class I)